MVSCDEVAYFSSLLRSRRCTPHAATFFLPCMALHPTSTTHVYPAVSHEKNRIFLPLTAIAWLMHQERIPIEGSEIKRRRDRCQGSEVHADARSGILLPPTSAAASCGCCHLFLFLSFFDLAAAATFESINR